MCDEFVPGTISIQITMDLTSEPFHSPLRGSIFDMSDTDIDDYLEAVVDKNSKVTQNQNEGNFKKLMDAVSEGNMEKAEKVLEDHPTLSSSKQNTYRGIKTSALQIAAENNNFPMVELLFDKPLEDDIDGPIDQTVSLQSALSSPAYICISYLHSQTENGQKVGNVDNEDGPNNPQETLKPCPQDNKSHFLENAFKRSQKLTQLVSVLDYTVWKETLERLEENLTMFTVEILNSCITVDEVGKLLEGEHDNSCQDYCNHFVCDRVNKELSLANMAIETKQKRFIVQEKCQHFLKEEWLLGQPDWAKKKGKIWSSIYLIFSIFVFGIICQVIPVQLFFCRETWLQKFFHSPKTALMTHYYTYASFLLFFFIYDISVDYKINDNQIVVVSNINYWPILIMSLIWFVALLIDEIVGVLEEGKKFFKSYWNLLDFFIFTFFIASVILGNPLFFGKVYPNPYICIILSKLASLSFIFALLRLLKPLYLSHFLGPMLIIFTDMRHDIFRFLIIFGYVVLAFALAMYYFYVDLGSDQSGFADLSSSLTILITTIFGGDGTDDLQVDQNMWFNTSSELSGFASAAADYYVAMGYVLYTFFGIIVLIMLLNLCIAMMSDRYTRVQEVIDLEWKFERTKIWMYYICAKRPPMTPGTTVCYLILILGSPLIICFRYFFCKGKVEDVDQENPEVGNVDNEDGPNNPQDIEKKKQKQAERKMKRGLAKLSYHKFLKLLLHRYYVKHLKQDETRSGKESQGQKQESPQSGPAEKKNANDQALALYDLENEHQ
ncbi:short transient receptor potential channel 4-like isoform X2 [Ptychodera flava]|uniref:short transient receptor potential channel 4-like isoform X2 n=1 Tax=Ptychodera flava TaxID=63121 RepID=UPI003969D92F